MSTKKTKVEQAITFSPDPKQSADVTVKSSDGGVFNLHSQVLMANSKVFLAMEDMSKCFLVVYCCCCSFCLEPKYLKLVFLHAARESNLPLPHAAKDLLLFFRLLYNVVHHAHSNISNTCWNNHKQTRYTKQRPLEPPSAADCITIMKLVHQYDCTLLALDYSFEAREDFFDEEKLDSLIESKELQSLINAAADCKMDDLESSLLDHMAKHIQIMSPSFEQVCGDVNPRSCKKLLAKVSALLSA